MAAQTLTKLQSSAFDSGDWLKWSYVWISWRISDKKNVSRWHIRISYGALASLWSCSFFHSRDICICRVRFLKIKTRSRWVGFVLSWLSRSTHQAYNTYLYITYLSYVNNTSKFKTVYHTLQLKHDTFTTSQNVSCNSEQLNLHTYLS